MHQNINKPYGKNAVGVLINTLNLEKKNEQVITNDNACGKGDVALFQEKAEWVSLNFNFDQEKRILQAVLEPGTTQEILTRPIFQQKIIDLGVESYYFNNDAIDSLIVQFRDHAYGIYPIAECRDAIVDLVVSDDGQEAFITTEKAYGGLDITRERLEASLIEFGIQPECWLDSRIELVLDTQAVDSIKIAQGRRAIDGIDGTFEAYVEEFTYPEDNINANGKIDFNEREAFTEVVVGQPLMRYTPATEGVDGLTVLGAVLTAKKGKDKAFSRALEGAEICSEDDNLLIASRQGHPIVSDTGVQVEDVLVIGEANSAVGNIDFDGSVMIRGDVNSGITVKATGDIVVKGVVNSAFLQAGNDICVHAGIVGKDALPESLDAGEALDAAISAGGSISARYVTLSSLKAGASILVKEYVSHSMCYAEADIMLGQSGGRGMLIGGKTRAVGAISANVLGADSGIKTSVYAGCDPRLSERVAALTIVQNDRAESLNKLEKIQVKFMASMQAGTIDNVKKNKLITVNNTVAALKREIDKTKLAITSALSLLESAKGASIQVRKATHGNVSVDVNGKSLQVRQESPGGLFTALGSGVNWQARAPK